MLELLDRLPFRESEVRESLIRNPAGQSSPVMSPAIAIEASLANALLDEVDYPMLLISADLRLLFANKTARYLLMNDSPVQIENGRLLCVPDADGGNELRAANNAATQRGLRRLIRIRSGLSDQPSGDKLEGAFLAVIPIAGPDGENRALLMLSKPGICQELSVLAYAKERALTPRETMVLRALCDGLSPDAIAEALGVAISTVRSQIASIRTKTGSADIGELVRRLAVLPPLVNVLRSVPTSRF